MKPPMRRYRASDYPVLCSDCNRPIRYVPERWAWVHVEKGVEHAPHVAGAVQS